MLIASIAIWWQNYLRWRATIVVEQTIRLIQVASSNNAEKFWRSAFR